jgi:hypothetical protein
MPWYEYRCEANERTLEVMHPMGACPSTWGELCALADEAPGDTDPSSPVEKAFNANLAIAGATRMTSPDPTREGPCGPSCGCHPH